ncbi:MAG: hypothetical protein ACOCVG_02440, partial [Verrucomicrobiota bacterium]
MKKFLLIFLLLIVLVIGALFVFGNRIVSAGLTAAVNEFGPQMTETPVTLENTEVNLAGGTLTLNNFVIGPPEGFDASPMSLGKVEIGVVPKSLFSDRVIVKHVRITQPQLTVEQNMTANNLRRLLKNVQDFIGEKEQEREAQPPAEGEMVVAIREFIVREGQVTATVAGQPGVTVTLPPIEAQNLGGEEGVTPEEAVAMVIERLLLAALEAVAQQGGQLLEGAAGERLQESANEAIEQGGNLIRGLRDRLPA